MTINPASTIEETRAAMGKRLGEIIEAVIGDNRIKELMETVPHQESENAGIATGEIALKMGVITPDTKTALLVAQAAERTYQLAEKAAAVVIPPNKSLETSSSVSVADIRDYEDPAFKFVGSDRDPEILQYAQGIWMAAQMLLNNEISPLGDRIATPFLVSLGEGMEASNGFKAAAIELYQIASHLLATEGHVAAANKLSAVAEALPAPVSNVYEPSVVVAKLNTELLFAAQRAHAWQHIDTTKMEAIYEKLMHLTSLPVKTTTRPAPALAPGKKPAP